MPAEFVEQLQIAGKIVDYGPRDILFSEYDPASKIYVIASGEVALAVCMPKQTCRQIATVGQGELLGWSSVTGRSRLFDTARTLSPVSSLGDRWRSTDWIVSPVSGGRFRIDASYRGRAGRAFDVDAAAIGRAFRGKLAAGRA